MTDFFISYTGADSAWAEWIAWILEEANFSVRIQAWDFRPGGNFVVEMQRAATGSDRTIAVLSPDYLRSMFAMAEWAAAFVSDPDGTKGTLVPVLVRETDQLGLLTAIIHIKLVGLRENEAREKLLAGLVPGRARPESVRFPGGHLFPGPAVVPPDLNVAQAALNDLPLDEVPQAGPLPVGSRMPLAVNPLFVGREEALKTLAHQLRAGGTSAVGQVQIAAATGLGGIGKTQLASEFVHRYGRFFAGGVFWLNFADAVSVPTEVAACGRSLGLHSGYDSLSPEQQIRLVEEAWQSPLPRLLVFDNCEEEELLVRWRPRFGKARVLVTSRRAEWDPALGVNSVPLSTLTRSASIELLRRFRLDISESEPALDGIAEDLGDLPLALHLAGSFLKKYSSAPFAQPANYLESLRKADLLDHPSLQGRGSGLSPTGHEGHVGRTFALSFERLDPTDEIDALAIAFLARIAWFETGEPIPRTLLLEAAHRGSTELMSDLLTEDALRRLTDLGLVEANQRNDLLMHRLVGVWTRGLTQDQEAQRAVEEAILSEAARSNEARNPALLIGWRSHLRAETDRAIARKDRMAARLCDELGIHLWHAGDYSDARLYLESAVALHSDISGPEHENTASSLNAMGTLLNYLRDFDGALPYLERALAIREKVLGLEHPATATSLNDIGYLLNGLRRTQEAISYHRRALAIREKVLGTEHPDTARSLSNLSVALVYQKDLTGARRYQEHALAIEEAVLGPEHPDTATSLASLGGILRRQGDLVGARSYYERALDIQEKVLGPEHPAVATILNNLGLTLHAQGYAEIATGKYERALTIYEKAFGPKHPNLAAPLLNLGTLSEDQGDAAKARYQYERVVALQGLDANDVAEGLLRLGNIYFDQGNIGRARGSLEKSFSLFKALYGPNHSKTIDARRHLSMLPGARRLKKHRQGG